MRHVTRGETGVRMALTAVKQITDSEYDDEMIHEENREEIFE